MKRYLILEDGSIYEGEGFGDDCESSGEVVFTTGTDFSDRHCRLIDCPLLGDL